MNVTEFAEQIVFGKTLEDKLFVPGRLAHAARGAIGPKVDSLISPGRAAGIEMRHDKGGNVQPPSDNRLDNEQARGQLLHFLANHELLATELMALTLLKFPDAPPAFRQGILVTLQEEQEHTRMYLRRMQECGVEFGSYPLSGQFWRAIEPMQSPMDFVSRLSLTFEQANLDYSLHFAKVFRRLGDIPTADLLQKVYEDEIGHVQHGLHWFRQWKNPELTDWEAYQTSLEFPMSPQRGRGPRGAFNRDGRIRAGLTDDFIDAIEVFRQSRGRAPTVRWFDPAAESELAGEHSPRTEPLMNQLGKDLELVMVALAKQDDVVLVRKLPSLVLRKRLIDVGFDLPEFIRFDERAKLADRKLHNFSPWAWTPKNHQITAPLCDSAFLAPPPWSEDSRDMFRKSWGAERLREWLREHDLSNEHPSWFTSADCAGIPIYNLPGLKMAIGEIGKRGYSHAIFKPDLAASGRGQCRIACQEPLNSSSEAKVCSALSLSGTKNLVRSAEGETASKRLPIGVVEPELERLVDLSFLWYLPRDAANPKFLGWTRPLITIGRRYAGTRLGTSLAGCEERIKRFLLEDRSARVQSVVEWLEPRIVRELKSRKFFGYFGVDAIVCQNADGELKIKPLIELNPRTTMGHVALRLAKRLATGTEAEFRIFSKLEWDAAHQKLDLIPFASSRDGWKSGIIWFGEIGERTKLIPALLIGSDAIEALADSNSH